MSALCFNTFFRSAFYGIDPDLPGQVTAAASAGFEHIGPDSMSLLAYEQDGGSLEGLADTIAEAGLTTFELPALLFGADTDAARESAESFQQLARIFGARYVAANCFEPVDRAVTDNLRMINDILSAEGCGLAFEFLPVTPVNSIAATVDLYDAADVDGPCVLLDTWHFFRGPDTWDDLEALPLDRLAYVQFDDALPLESDDLLTESQIRRAFPGEGEFDLARFCDVLRHKGFDGVFSLELLAPEFQAMALDDFAGRAHETASRYWPG